MNKLKLLLKIKFIFYNLISNKKKLSLNLNELELNFQNLNFEDLYKLKNIYLKISNNFNKEKLSKEYYFQTFDWLFFAKKIGGNDNIKIAKKNIMLWNKFGFSFFNKAWEAEIASKRFINLIYFYDFYSQALSKKELIEIHGIINSHLIFIKIYLKNINYEKLSLGLVKSGLISSLLSKENIDTLNKKIILFLNFCIDKRGFHKSYNPSVQAEMINALYEIKNIYLYFKKPVAKEIEFQLINLTSVLNNLFHKDGSIALFNGANNHNNELFIKIMNQSFDIRTKELIDIKNGIAIYNDKNKKLFFDAVKPTSTTINENLHASTLSFEFSAKKEKIITNCGSLEKRAEKNPEYLRYSAAHSTIILNNTNISELIDKSSYKRIPHNIVYSKEENFEKIIMGCSHDGYLKNFGKIVKRKIYISKTKDKITGKDSILSIKTNPKPISFDIRFHLTPNCRCVLTNNKKTVLIKTESNNSWIFKFKNIVRIEESIYINNGKKIEQNKQIVISGLIKDLKHTEEWSLTAI
jgi:uncharacterized heparinase superfamily protein